MPPPSEKKREKKRSFSKGGGTSVHRLGPENGYGQAGMSIGVRAGGARGAAAPQSLGNSDFLGSTRKFGQSQFLKTSPCF